MEVRFRRDLPSVLYLGIILASSHSMLIACNMNTLLLKTILTVMVLLQPQAPWKDDYEQISRGLLSGATTAPVFDGEYGVQRTLALDISLAWFESRFDRHATGDNGAAHGLYQVHAKEAETVEAQTIEANKLIKASFRICRNRPLEERLGWYASGGNGCDRPGGLKASRHRMLKAMWLYRKFFEGKPQD